MLSGPSIRAALTAKALGDEVDCTSSGWCLGAGGWAGEKFPYFESRDQAIGWQNMESVALDEERSYG